MPVVEPVLDPPRTPPHPLLVVTDRATWRAWLAANHATAPGIWVVTYKPGKPEDDPAGADAATEPVVGYEALVEEALCFGWIDAKGGRVDERRTMLLFTPRRPGSPWSGLNKVRVARLEAAGLLDPAGQSVIAAARADGAWTSYDAVEAGEIPPDLAAALAGDAVAAAGFAALAPSRRKQLLWSVVSAKRPETRARRVALVVAAGRDRAAPHDPSATGAE